MLANTKTKIIIISLAFLIVGVLIFSGSGLIMLTARPAPSSDTPYPSINLPPSGAPSVSPYVSMSPTPIPDTRTWGERLRDKTIPQVPGVTWQTYTNTEYGFEMEYPKGFG